MNPLLGKCLGHEGQKKVNKSCGMPWLLKNKDKVLLFIMHKQGSDVENSARSYLIAHLADDRYAMFQSYRYPYQELKGLIDREEFTGLPVVEIEHVNKE